MSALDAKHLHVIAASGDQWGYALPTEYQSSLGLADLGEVVLITLPRETLCVDTATGASRRLRTTECIEVADPVWRVFPGPEAFTAWYVDLRTGRFWIVKIRNLSQNADVELLPIASELELCADALPSAAALASFIGYRDEVK